MAMETPSEYCPYITEDMDNPANLLFLKEQQAIYQSYQNYCTSSLPYAPQSKIVNEVLQQKNSYSSNLRTVSIAIDGDEIKVPPPSEKTPLINLKKTNILSMNSSNNSTAVPNKKLKKTDLWFSIYLTFYMMYLVLGSVTFEQMEWHTEVVTRQQFRDARQRILQKYSNIRDEDLEDFIQEVLIISGTGVSPLRNATSELNWSFGQALFFSSTVITTIGYGHVTPLTQSGKLFCILYAIIGIPLTLVLMSAVVERLMVPTSWILGKLNSKLGHLYQPFNIRLLHLVIIVSIFCVIFLAIPTLIFTILEPNWTAVDAFYYCFISLTTIGLGDYIPGDELNQANRSLYKIGTTIYLILGLIGVMLTLTVFYDIPQLNLGQLFTEHASDESEIMRLSLGGAPCYSGPSGLYIPQRDDEARRSVVRIRPRGDDSPSPDDDEPLSRMTGATTAARDIRVP